MLLLLRSGSGLEVYGAVTTSWWARREQHFLHIATEAFALGTSAERLVEAGNVLLLQRTGGRSRGQL